MKAALFLPNYSPRSVELAEPRLPDPVADPVRITDQVAALLGCPQDMVDVLASGTGYTAYSIFDYDEGDTNLEAMRLLTNKWG